MDPNKHYYIFPSENDLQFIEVKVFLNNIMLSQEFLRAGVLIISWKGNF